MLDYPDTCQDLFMEYPAKIVMGQPDDTWDDYVKEFYAMGGDKIEQEVNEACKGPLQQTVRRGGPFGPPLDCLSGGDYPENIRIPFRGGIVK